MPPRIEINTAKQDMQTPAQEILIDETIYETDEEEFGGDTTTTKTTTTNKHYIKKMPTVRKTKQEYKLAYFSLWWSRMIREGKKEETERLSKERSSVRLSRRGGNENICDTVPLTESRGEEMAENDCIDGADVLIVPVGEDNKLCSHDYTSVGEIDSTNTRGVDMGGTVFGGGGEVLTENVPVINGGTQYKNQYTQYVDNTRNIVLARLAPVFSVGRTEVRRGDRGLEIETSGASTKVT